MFYLEQKDNYNLGGSNSDSSEKPFWRGGRKASVLCDFGKGRIYAIRHTFLQNVAASLVKVTASHEKHMSPWKILVLF